MSKLEHVNITVSDSAATARWLDDVFGWAIRWQGDSKAGGHSKHIGNADQYIVAYEAPHRNSLSGQDYGSIGWLNHIGVVVDDLDTIEARVRAAGFTPYNHGDYEPGRRFYFDDADGIEWEVIAYS